MTIDRDDRPQHEGVPAEPARGTGLGCTAHRPLRRVAVELPIAAALAFVVSIGVQRLVVALRLPSPALSSEATLVCAASTGLLATALVVAIGWSRVRRIGWVGAAVAALSAIATLAIALPLAGTRLYLGGIGNDQEFRTQYLARLAASPRLADMNYADMPPFYPGAWFWLGGRFADLTGVPPWAAYKPFAIGTVAVAAAVSFTLWGVLVRRRTALLLALVTLAAGLQVTTTVGVLAGIEEPYTWLLCAMLPPMTAIALHLLGCGLARGGGWRAAGHWPGFVGVGLFLGLLIDVYTLYAGFAALVTVVLAVVAAVPAARSVGRWRPVLALTLVRLVVIGGVAVVCALPIWGPYLLAAARDGFPPSLAPHYLADSAATLPFPMVVAVPLGALCLAGAVWALFAATADETARALALLAGCVYVWYGLSALALAAGTTLLEFRLSTPLTITLACAGTLGAVRLAGLARRRLAERHRPGLRLVGAGLALLVVVPATQSVPHTFGGVLGGAYQDYYPTGFNALGQRNPADQDAWLGEVGATIGSLTTTPADQLVVLTADYHLLAYEPYFGFQQSRPEYANPLAHFDERRLAVRNWAAATSPADLLARLDRGPFRPPTVFVLTRAADGLHVPLSRDIFPLDATFEFTDAVFPATLFDPAHFTVRDVGPFVVAVRR